jgi:phosphopantothenoylcysteine decarboxylase/phosphopantothenate--cysteine ligase
VNITVNDDRIKVLKVTTANEMLDAVKNVWADMDIGVFAAAVADYRPKNTETKKIKKSSDNLTVDMVKNPDILKWAGEQKSERQCLVGFALETNDLVKNSSKKLVEKNLDIIVMNSLKDKGAGFGGDTNKISILDNRNKTESYELKSKNEVAKDILRYVKKYIK